ncbi:hypothetical protein SDC9_60558 [bioreactor metagenome]|uniref:Uncharacterized protein n=1 Tax=bioreactor metagenome TaxID=1076179 RepID=A0A644XEJ9_9ZZZZ
MGHGVGGPLVCAGHGGKRGFQARRCGYQEVGERTHVDRDTEVQSFHLGALPPWVGGSCVGGRQNSLFLTGS